MKEHRHAEVLRAIADGKTVQRRYQNDGWVDYVAKFHCSIFDCAETVEWRVKPQPKPDYSFYAGYNRNEGGGTLFMNVNNVSENWEYKMKITIDGETNEPKSVELVK